MNPNEGGNVLWWLNLFLARTFFQACNGDHHINPENPENRYCIDCNMAACQRCMAQPTHNNHRVLTIYRLVYKDVVTHPQMSRHIDCSEIQRYASNGRQVVSLHPLPHNNSGQIHLDRACLTCTRVLMNPDMYSYCSIKCKPDIQPAPPHVPRGDVGAASGSGAGGRRQGRGGGGGGGRGGTRSNSWRSRARKGVPHRSPLF